MARSADIKDKPQTHWYVYIGHIGHVCSYNILYYTD